MARKSQAAATVAQVINIRPAASRLPVPPDMPDEQSEVWRTTTAALPADWFGLEHGPMLALYCRHIARAGQIERAIGKLDPVPTLRRSTAWRSWPRWSPRRPRCTHALCA